MKTLTSDISFEFNKDALKVPGHRNIYKDFRCAIEIGRRT